MKKNKIKLMIIVPTLRVGGQERVAVTTANLLSDQFDITFVVFDKTEAVFIPSCAVIDLKVPAKQGLFKKVHNALMRSKAIRKIKKTKSIDITLSFGSTANLVNVLSKTEDKVIINLRSFGAHSSKFLGVMKSLTYRRSDMIICCSKEIVQSIYYLKKSYGEKTRLLYNPYDIEYILEQGAMNVRDYSFNDQTIISVGRLDKYKNYSRLIKAFFIVNKMFPESRLLIVGEGAERKNLEYLISHLEIDDSVTLIGFRENPFSYLEKASLFVLSSLLEGFPNALVEGMVFLPVVAVDCRSGPKEILYEQPKLDEHIREYKVADYGILVPDASQTNITTDITNDDYVLANAIIHILSYKDFKEDMKLKAHQRTYNFSDEAYKNQIINILRDNIDNDTSKRQ